MDLHQFSPAQFANLRVAVLGDLIADHWLYARPTRLSREAPVLVLRHEEERLAAGGAANVARNLRALGASVAVFGALGRDAAGRELAVGLGAERIDVAGVEHVDGWTTPTKTRVLAAEPRRNPVQVLRIDREPSTPLARAVAARVVAALRARSASFDALLLSDYEYGLLGDEAAALARDLRTQRKTVVLDPRRELARYAHALTALTPNVGELAELTHSDAARLDDPRELRRAAHALHAQLAPRWLLVTRGNLGMALFGEDLPDEGVFVEASGDGEVTDVCGAGDTAAAVFTLALAAGRAPIEAMELANAASGVVVMEHGAATCSPAQLEAALVAAPSAVRGVSVHG